MAENLNNVIGDKNPELFKGKIIQKNNDNDLSEILEKYFDDVSDALKNINKENNNKEYGSD